MQTAIIITMLLVFAAAGITLAVVYAKYLKPTKNGMSATIDTSFAPTQEQVSVTDTKSYLTYKELCPYSINLGLFQYRAIIECSSISYVLRTPQERDMIEYGFQGFLNSLTYPVVFYVQTRTIDNSRAISRMAEKGKNAVKEHPFLRDYVDNYIANMEHLAELSGVPKCKKKYLIIPYDLESDLSSLSDEEKEQFCQEELANRVSFCCQNLQSIGITAKVLRADEIAATLYASFNRNEYFLVADIIKGALNRLFVNGDNMTDDLDIPSQIASILFQTRNSIEQSLYGLDDNDTETLALYRGVCSALDTITREINAGHNYGKDIVEYITNLGVQLENERRGVK